MPGYRQRMFLAITAVGALALGVFVYFLDRDPQQVYLLRDLLRLPLLASPIFGSIGAFLPTFTHVFAFILLSIAALAPNKRGTLFICLGWFVFALASELAQYPSLAPYVIAAVPAWFDRVPVLANTVDYFRHGTFDLRDVLSIIVGTLAAWLMASWASRTGRSPTANLRFNRVAKYGRGLAGSAILFLGVAATIGSGGGGGGGTEEPVTPPASGEGADAVPIFWLNYGSGLAGGSEVQQTSDGGFIAAGTENPDATKPSDLYVVKTDAHGTTQWQKSFSGTGRETGQSVRQTADGGYIVAGCVDCDANPKNFYLLKLDGDGNKVWDKPIAESSLAGAYAVRETKSGSSPDGYIFVGSDLSQNVALFKTDTVGDVLWQQSFASTGPGAGWDVGFSVEQTADGGYAVAGDYAGAEMWLIKTDENGIKVWDKRFGKGEAFSVKQTTDGGYILAGRTSVRTFKAPSDIANDKADAVVIKTDKDGNEMWRKTFGGAEDDEAHSVASTLDGGYVITGKTLSYGPGPVDYNQSYQWEDVLLIKLDANGNTVWQKVKGHRPNSSDGGASVQAVSDGGYIVTGNSNAYPSGTFLLAKTDKNGDTVNLGTEDLSVNVPSSIGMINFTNAIDVASAGVQGFTLPREVGAITLDILIDVANGASPADICDGGGSYSASLNPAGPVAAGSTLSVTFADCVTSASGTPSTLTGNFSLTVENMSGSLSSATYSVQTTVDTLDVTSSESGGSLTNTITGGTRFLRQATSGDYSELSQSIAAPSPATLTFSEAQGGVTRTRVLGPFAFSDSVASSGTGSYSFGVTNETATVDPKTTAGLLTVTILQSAAGASLGAAPSSGSFRITAQDNSRMTATISGTGITLAIDTNADGVDDGTIATTWEFLN